MNNEYEPEIDVPEENLSAGLPVHVKNPVPAVVAAQPVTATQAKVNAIADLTHSAYSKAGMLELTKEESEALTKDFPDEAFKPGADGKENLIYIEHAYLRDRLTQVFGMGKWAIIPRRSWSEKFILPPNYNRKESVEGERVYVEAMLIIRGCFVAEAIGDMAYYPKNNAQNYGDAVEGAKTASLRRCCKEFGVGLQAWKKDWCEGWMQRKRSPLLHRPPAKPLSRDPVPAPAPTLSKQEKFLSELKTVPPEQLLQFCIDLSWLMPNQGINELEDRFLPKTRGEMNSFKSCMDNWAAKGDLVQPYDCPIPDPAKKPIEVLRQPDNEGFKSEPNNLASSETWYGCIVPIPYKGMKRDEYIKNPDTIGSLYELRHGNDEGAAEARKRLWGFVNHYEPKGWVKKDGTQMPPSASDITFRKELDNFIEWFEKNHPDEKL